MLRRVPRRTVPASGASSPRMRRIRVDFRAVRADQADAIAAHDPHREIFDKRSGCEALAHPIELGNQLARALTGIESEANVSEPVASRSALDSQSLETAHASFVARSAGLDAFADPGLLLLPELVETAPRGVFRREFLVLALLIGREVAGVGAQYAAVQFDDAGGDPIEEGAIVGDERGRRHLKQQLLQSFDGFDIEMIGGLIEQQQIRL